MKTFYRITAPLIALVSIPVLYFLPLFRVLVTSSISLSDNEKVTNLFSTVTGLKEFFGIDDLVAVARKSDGSKLTLLKTLLGNLDEETKNKIFGEYGYVKPLLIAAGVCLALFVLLMLACAVLSAALKKHTPALIVSVAAAVTLFASKLLFNGFAKPFLSGGIGLSSLFSSSNAEIGSLLGRLLSVNALQLSVAYTVSMLIAVVFVIFTAAVIIDENYERK